MPDVAPIYILPPPLPSPPPSSSLSSLNPTQLPNQHPQNNTPTEFRWFGSLPYIFSGAHYYRFQDSAVTAGHTTLVQGEAFTGALAFMVGEGWKWGKQTREGFEKFNGELRARVVGAG